MVWLRNKIKGWLLSLKKLWEAFQTTLYKSTRNIGICIHQTKKNFSFNPPFSIEESGLIGLTGLEWYISIFNITEGNIKFELFTHNFDEFWFT